MRCDNLGEKETRFKVFIFNKILNRWKEKKSMSARVLALPILLPAVNHTIINFRFYPTRRDPVVFDGNLDRSSLPG